VASLISRITIVAFFSLQFRTWEKVKFKLLKFKKNKKMIYHPLGSERHLQPSSAQKLEKKVKLDN